MQGVATEYSSLLLEALVGNLPRNVGISPITSVNGRVSIAQPNVSSSVAGRFDNPLTGSAISGSNSDAAITALLADSLYQGARDAYLQTRGFSGANFRGEFDGLPSGGSTTFDGRNGLGRAWSGQELSRGFF